MLSIEKVFHVAKMQKRMLYGFLGALLSILAAMLLLFFKTITSIHEEWILIAMYSIIFVGCTAGIVHTIYYFRLAFALEVGGSVVILYLIGIFFPLFTFLSLLWINGKANKAIREKGFIVGLLGANLEEIESRLHNVAQYQETFL